MSTVESGRRSVRSGKPVNPDPWRELNDTRQEFPRQMCLHELFEARATEHPGDVAIFDADGSISYAEIERDANRLAHYLRRVGVGPDVPIGLCLTSGRARAIGILAVLKAGGCYLPLAPDYPAERLEYMLKDSAAPVVVTTRGLRQRLPAAGGCVICLDQEAARIAELSDSRPDSLSDPENLAYLIYTSGSTGLPKGIAVRHRGVVNNLVDLTQRFSITKEDRGLAISSLSFDMCVFEILGLLGAGASIVMPKDELLKEPAEWSRLIGEHQITIWNSAPALLEMLVEHNESRADCSLQSLRLALLGGDWIPVSLPDRFRALSPQVQVISLGGATEASIHSTIHPIEGVDPAWPSIPYGRPMANQTTHVLDENLQPVALGEAGELYIGGVGVAHGYLGRSALTAERFLPDPWSSEPGSRMYRTGDLVRLREGGELELLGRVDFQVKIRGHRIELREIESALLAHDAVAEAVVAGIGEGSGRSLVAYVVPGRDLSIAGPTVQRELDHWQSVYDETYENRSEAPAARDFSGWVSSFTGRFFSREELDEVVDETLSRLRRLNPRSVLEVGCGTGLLLLELAPDCARYDASDFSPRALDSVRRQILHRGENLCHVTLERRTAADWSSVSRGAYDLVLVNSVTQHFPGIEYLVRVLEGALDATAPGGYIFLGDVRCLPLLRAFHSALELAGAPDEMTLVEFEKSVEHRLRREKELWIDPAFFPVFAELHTDVAGVEIRLRRAGHWNEMSVFHHDVLLRKVGADEPGSIAWTEEPWSPGTLDTLSPGEKTGVVLRGVPDARTLEAVVAARRGETADEHMTVGDLRQRSKAAPATGIEPSAIWQHAEERGLRVELLWPASGAVGTFDVKFWPSWFDSAQVSETLPVSEDTFSAQRPSSRKSAPTTIAWESFGNRNRGYWGTSLGSELRRFLRRTLPEIMVPSEFVMLDALPLSPNGKVDRKALPVPAPVKGVAEDARGRLATDLERLIADLWSEILGISGVDRSDDFFELGGHSLSATQITSRLRDLFSLEVPLASVFEHSTIEKFASHLQEAGVAAGIDLESAASIALEVTRLSDEEVSRALEREAE